MPFKHKKRCCSDPVINNIQHWHIKCNQQNNLSMINGRKIKCPYGIKDLDETKDYQSCYTINNKLKDYKYPRRTPG